MMQHGCFLLQMARSHHIVSIMPNLKQMLLPEHRLVVVLAYDGLCTFEFGQAVEIFGLPRPEMGEDWYRFAIASLDEGELRAMGGLRLLVDGGLELLDQAGTIIIPGWRGIHEPVPERLIAALKSANKRGCRILSICSGVFVLAASGLLDKKRATTHWRYSEALASRFPTVEVLPDVLYVDEGNVLSSAGSAAGIDLCLHLVRRDFGTKAANMVARRLVVQPHRDGGQAQFIERPVVSAHESGRFSPLLDAMRQRIDHNWTIAELAMLAGMSGRSFLRRFETATGQSPAQWLLQQRLSEAKSLLESSDLSVDEIALTCGFGSATNFRHHFRRQLSLTPTAYRQRFKPHEGSRRL
jgi:AraC family transcriptional activator FtrA